MMDSLIQGTKRDKKSKALVFGKNLMKERLKQLEEKIFELEKLLSNSKKKRK